MNRNLEMIVTNRDSAMQHLEGLKGLKKAESLYESLTNHPCLSDDLADLENAAEKNWEQANNEFWEAFKYPLEIFDLHKGELPNEDECVQVFDEQDKQWFNLIFRDNGFVWEYDESVQPIETNHRWTRLPKLEGK